MTDRKGTQSRVFFFFLRRGKAMLKKVFQFVALMLAILFVNISSVVAADLSPATERLLSDRPVVSTSVQRSTTGSSDWGHGFGYTDGVLMYSPWFGKLKGVLMTEQTVRLEYKCTALVKGTEHVATVVITAAVNPSLKVESDFHRLIAVYGAVGTKEGSKNMVNADDIRAGATTYLGQFQERLCGLIYGRSLKDLLKDPSIGYAEMLGRLVKQDLSSPFEVKVQTVRVVFPEEFLRALALKALEVPPAPKVVKKPAKPKVAKPVAVHPQPCCACMQVCTTPVRK